MTTPSFICELPLVLVSDDKRRLLIRLDCARQVYNAVLGESLKRLALLRQSRAFQTAQRLRGKTRLDAFRALDTQFRLREYDLHAYATQFGRSWLDGHLDALTIQTLASRAWNAVRQYQVGSAAVPDSRVRASSTASRARRTEAFSCILVRSIAENTALCYTTNTCSFWVCCDETDSCRHPYSACRHQRYQAGAA
jgi:hypothetical protein